MNRQILLACLPYLSLLVCSCGVAWLLAKLTRARPDWRQIRLLPADQRGAVQSLSFVLTVPAFVMVMMFIVQLSQLTIAKVVVEYSALATARSAQVWVPADLSAVGGGGPNQLPCWNYIGDQIGPDGWNYSVYQIPQGGVKYHKIRQAAIQSLVPICPSRDTGAPLGGDAQQIAQSMQAATLAYASGMAANPKVATRLQNKLAYALATTRVNIEVRHKGDEPPLMTYLIDPYPDEFRCGEIGWHDQLIITVAHDFALLPGPGRLLARRSTPYNGGTDTVADRIQGQNGVYFYTLQATARLYNEGQKPRIGFAQSFPGPALALRNGTPSRLASVLPTSTTSSDPLASDAVRNHARLGDPSLADAACCDETAPQMARKLPAADLPTGMLPTGTLPVGELPIDSLPSVLRRRGP